MRGHIIINSIIAVLCIIIGWTACILFENSAILTLDLSTNVSDVLALVVNVILALYIAWVVERGIQNRRVEKDFYIKEIDIAESIFSDLEQECIGNDTLLLDKTVQKLSRSRRILFRVWKLKTEADKSFLRENQEKYNELLLKIKEVDKSLTDTGHFNSDSSVTPIKITRGKITLNSSIRPAIEDAIGHVRTQLFQMKVLINNG